MSKTILKTDKAPAPIGPYNQAVKVGDLIYTSGQIPIDLRTGDVCEGGAGEQTHLVLTHLKNILEAAGSSLSNVVKANVFLKNIHDFADMNAVYKEFFSASNAPARSTIEVARLPKDVLVEIEVVATL